MILITVEAVPVNIKPPAADISIRSFTGEKCGFGASAPLLTRVSPVHFSIAFKRGSTIMPKLVKLVAPPSNLAEELSPCFARSPAAAPSVRL